MARTSVDCATLLRQMRLRDSFKGSFRQVTSWLVTTLGICTLWEKSRWSRRRGKPPRSTACWLRLVPYGIPVVVRLSIAPDGTGEVVGKIGRSPRFPDVLTVNRIAKVSQAEIDEFVKLLADSGFWSMPVFETIDPHDFMMGEPGWMFEREKEGSYHVVCRGTSSLASLKKAVMFLVDVSKLDLASTTIRSDDGRKSRDEIQ
jgi:hypothetical protein